MFFYYWLNLRHVSARTEWPSSGSLLWNMQHMDQLLEFSHLVKTVLCLQFLKLILWQNTVEMQLKYGWVQYKIKYSIKLCVVSKFSCFHCLLVWSRFSESVNVDNKILIRTLKMNKKDIERERGREEKKKAVPLQAWTGPEGSRKLRLPDFVTTAQDGGRLSALRTGCFLPPGNTPGTHFC